MFEGVKFFSFSVSAGHVHVDEGCGCCGVGAGRKRCSLRHPPPQVEHTDQQHRSEE